MAEAPFENNDQYAVVSDVYDYSESEKNMLLIESQVVRQLIRSKLFANEQSQVLWFLSPYVDAYIYIYYNIIYIYCIYVNC